ncbi:porin family protein [Flavobacterium daemonense]|uniref:porin family protein n=1 Tax=Flavobacterium daemonense TaxID=1393049 RepID=UPI001185CDEE|nr:porin family protein [Flavobacterium daemonense]KAF2330237.1 PorT family protein [Flavobacterium daemonense]
MKKIILSTIALMAFAFSNAQETRFGVKGGLNLANFTGDFDTNLKAGFHIGGFAEIKIIERLAIQPELLFSTQGARYNMDGGGKDSGAYKLNYINVPVLAKFYVTKKFTVESGPQIGFLVSAKNESRDIKDAYKTADYGFNFGAGYNFTDNFSVGLRYTVGLSGIYDRDYVDFSDYYDSTKNSNLQLSLAYKFK